MTDDDQAKSAESALLHKAMVDNDADLIHAVAEAYRLNAETQRRQDKIVVALGVLFALIGLMALVSTVSVITLSEVRKSTKVVKDNSNINKANGRVVKDCVAPTGECYQRNQARTGEVVGLLGNQTIAAVICARNETLTDDEVAQCVADRLAENSGP